MRIFVTGGAGFIGSAFTQTALARGHQVGGLTRTANRARVAGERWFVGSIADPPWREIERFAPEIRVHSAWVATPGIYLESAENYDWLQWSADFLARMPAFGARHIVSLGTCIEYKATDQILREDSAEIAPSSNYARCKHQLHSRIRRLLADLGVTLTWARLFYPYGSGEHAARLASWVIRKLRAGEPIVLKTPHSIKDYIHIDDVAAAILILAEKPFDGPVNVGTGRGVSVESIARQIAVLTGQSDLVQTANFDQGDSSDFVVADTARLQSLDWRPEVDLETGLARMLRDFHQ